MRISGKILAGVLSACLVCSTALAAEQEAPLTFKERLAKMQTAEKTVSVTTSSVLPGHVYIPKDTQLKMELAEDINSKKNKKNQTVKIMLTENLIINNVIVIPQGTIGTAWLAEARKAGGFGRKGRLSVEAREIKTLNNVTVPLSGGINTAGKTDGGAAAVAVAVSLVGGVFMKGTNAEYPVGTQLTVTVQDDVDLLATPEQLVEVMNPAIPHGVELQVKAY